MGDLTKKQKRQVIDFVRKKSFRRERTILDFICAKFEHATDSAYELAMLVEHGPLEWFGADEEKHGPDKAGEMQLMYKYNPKKKSNEALRNTRN